ncbi:DUF1254 domain-containing protein [Candidatus Protochlamydia phocaeensis]|uniref:DUF1254 domain-containing protein n=1 Tax=Candidatus Protochlamydia phocaeensis TaxID=1414722 RepID=UPI000A5E2DDD|nr:DUF1214 domain-containing protein [Candidatus Protochlamydia phocaeensis]
MRYFAICLSFISMTTLFFAEAQDGGTTSSSSLSPEEAVEIATDAYIYGYSLITTEITRVQMSNVSKMDEMHAPMGQFINVKRYPPADYRGVSAPNADTLYSIAWVDLSEPQVFSHPDMGKRFYLFEMTDLWMIDFAAPGSRTAGGEATNYLLTGPGWKGQVPDGMKHIPVNTLYMVILGRIYANGSEEDYKKVNLLQSQLKLIPLSSWGKNYEYKAPPINPNPGFDMTAKPQEVINEMDISAYFNLMTKLMGSVAPPPVEDASILARMAKIGLISGQPFDISKFSPEIEAAIKKAGKVGMSLINKNQKNMGSVENGWTVSKGLGIYGTDYLKRATVAAFGWPANREKDAVYSYTFEDKSGNRLTGANKYTLTFEKGRIPPVNGFWSITMYEVDNGWWFVPNPLNKFTVSERNELKYNSDGSLTLYFQNESPGKDKESNWLPAPKTDFLLMLRMYWPKEKSPSILNNTWQPPAVIKITE